MSRNLCYCGKGYLVPVTREMRQALASEGRILGSDIGRICSQPHCRITTSGHRVAAAHSTTNELNQPVEPATT